MKFLTKHLTLLLFFFPFILFSQSSTYCINALAVETYSVTPSDNANTFLWTINPNIAINNESSSSITIDWSSVTSTGIYTLTFKETSSLSPDCSAELTYTINIVDGPQVDEIDNMYVCEFTPNVDVSAIATGNNLSFDWGQTTDGSSDVQLNLIDVGGVGAGYDSNTDLNSNQTLTVDLIVTDDNQCETQTDFDIIVVNTPNPSVITNP